MNLEEREAYAEIIINIYHGEVEADESMITDDVAYIVETMLQEIRSCTVNLGIFISVVNGVADALVGMFEGVDPPITNGQQFTGDSLKSGAKDWFKNKVADFGLNFALSFTKTWIDILRGNLQSVACVNTTALNWRSALTIALTGA